MKPLRSKSEVISSEKISRLEDEIKSSKQAVVKHILLARALERNLTIIRTSDQSLKDHLKSKFRPKIADDLGVKVVWLEKKVIVQIEASAKIEGRGYNLQQAYNSYNDDELCAALQLLPGTSHHVVSPKSRSFLMKTANFNDVSANDGVHYLQAYQLFWLLYLIEPDLTSSHFILSALHLCHRSSL